MNTKNINSNDLSTTSGKRNVALILASSIAISGIMISASHSEKQRTDDLMKQKATEWTKERVEKVLTHIPGAQNSEVIPESIKIAGGGHNLNFAITKDGEEYVIQCNITDNSCSNPRRTKPHQFENVIPSEK